MTVWLVWTTHEYDNYSVISVHSTEELAVQRASKLAKDYDYQQENPHHWKGSHGNSISVEEREVDSE